MLFPRLAPGVGQSMVVVAREGAVVRVVARVPQRDGVEVEGRYWVGERSRPVSSSIMRMIKMTLVGKAKTIRVTRNMAKRATMTARRLS